MKDDRYYIDKMLEDITFINKNMRDTSKEKLTTNEILLDSMMFRLIQISEHAVRVSDTFKNKHTGIPWFEMTGLRNRIVHDYGNVDLTIIYDTLKKDIPELKRKLKQL